MAVFCLFSSKKIPIISSSRCMPIRITIVALDFAASFTSSDKKPCWVVPVVIQILSLQPLTVSGICFNPARPMLLDMPGITTTGMPATFAADISS